MEKILLVMDKQSLVDHSGGGKYIFTFVPLLKEKYEVEILYQPENQNMISGLKWRLFELPKLIKEKYKSYIILFFAEHYLNSIRNNFINRTIIIIHHYPYLFKTKTIKDRIVKIMSYITFNTILKKIRNIIVVSKETENELIKLGIGKESITYIPNSFDLSAYKVLEDNDKKKIRKSISEKYDIPYEKKWLFYVGTNELRKNFTILLKILSLLDEKYILVRVGNDVDLNETEKAKALIKAHKLEKRYYHLQNLEEKELINLYQTTDMFVMPSLYEGFGRPIIESQACGLPVISTKGGALKEVCGKGALLIENPYNENEFIDKINLIESRKSNMLKEGIENAKKYARDTNVQFFFNLINKI